MVKVRFSNQQLFARKFTEFLFLEENICWFCGYPLKAPRWGASDEYLQNIFSPSNKKNTLLLFLARAVKSVFQDKYIEISYLSSGKWDNLDKLGMVFPQPPPPPHPIYNTHTHTNTHTPNVKFFTAVTLKDRSRSPESNQLFVQIICPWKFAKNPTNGLQNIVQKRKCRRWRQCLSQRGPHQK